MGYRELKYLLEADEAGGHRVQIKNLTQQIKDAKSALKDAKSGGMEGIQDLEKQLTSIYKQIEDKKLGNHEKEEVNYYTTIANNKEELLSKAREDAGMVLPPEEEPGWTISPWLNISEAVDPCDAQTKPLRSQLTQLKKQLSTVKSQAELQQTVIAKTIALNKINAETAKATKNKSQQTAKATNAFNRKIDNANKALNKMPEIEGVARISEQEQPTPDCSKELKSLNNEMLNLNNLIMKYTQLASEQPPTPEVDPETIAEDIMNSLQGGYPDATGGSNYTFQSKGPLGSEPELEDEGFTTFYGDSDNHWSGYNFDSGGPDLGEDPETMEEERYKVNYNEDILQEKFASKDQMKYLYSNEPEAAKKLASKMTKKDYKKLPKKVKKSKKEGTMRDFDDITNEASFPVYRYCRPKNAAECNSGCQEGKKCTKISDCGSSSCCKCVKAETKKGKKNKKDGRIKELQVWGVNSNPGFGLGEVPRTPMYSDVPGPAVSNTMGGLTSESKKPKMKKRKLLEYLSELTTRSGKNGKVYKKKDLTKSSAPFSEKVKSLDEIKKIINKSLKEAPIDYGDRPERISPDIESKLGSQETPFGKDFPGFPKVDDDSIVNNYEELIASERFKNVVDTFKRHTGIEGNATDMQNLMGLQGMMMQSLQNTLRIEATHKQKLEELAIEIVKRDSNVPEGSLQFDVELTGMQKLSKDDMRQKPKNQEQSLEQEEETLEHMEELDLEVSKRRMINAMMQGSAKKSLYLYHMVSEELNEIDPSLINLYGVVISANDLMYWIMPDMMMGGGGGEGAQVFGKEKIDLSTNPPTIVAKGMTFPVLVHELHKGVMEYLSLHGLPGDKELRQKVMDKADFLEDEMWDLRLGPGLWERFIDAIGANDFDVKNHLYTEIIQMPAREFLDFIKEIQSGSDKGKQRMTDLANKIKEEIQKDEYEEATGEYEEDDDAPIADIPGFEGTMEDLDDISVSDLFPQGSGGPEDSYELDIDSILDKISDSGMGSLKPEELQFLKDQSK